MEIHIHFKGTNEATTRTNAVCTFRYCLCGLLPDQYWIIGLKHTRDVFQHKQRKQHHQNHTKINPKSSIIENRPKRYPIKMLQSREKPRGVK